MSAFKGTPGPWRECGHERGGCICGLVFATSADVAVADASLSCDAETREYRPDEAARKANARLIAAAPELLEALEEMVRMYGHRGGVDPYSDALLPVAHQPEEVSSAMAAIAKATGGDA